MDKAIYTVRELAREYLELSNLDINRERLALHRKVNDLEMERPVVLLDELPWNQLNVDDQLTNVCTDPVLKDVETMLRRKIFQFKYFPGDMVLTPYVPVQKVIIRKNQLSIEEETLAHDGENNIIAHEYIDQLKTEEDLDKILLPVISYDEKTTMARYQRVGDVLGDILPVKLKGQDHYAVSTWDDISMYRGVTPLLMDLIDRPEVTHKMVRKLTDGYISALEQYEALGLFDNDPQSLHCTPIANSTLKPGSEDKITRKNVWGRGVAQILASASKAMRDEFDIMYMKETVGQCGLVYYGCCEPLDTMVDIVEKIPNIRKIGVTPWANPQVAAEAIGSKYVFSSKPNPASVAVDHLNEDNLRKELTTILAPCKANKCNVDITLKDISSANYNLDNIIRWEQIAMEMAKDF